MKRFEKKYLKQLLWIMKILDKNSIPYWIESGTLLGFIRDKKNLIHHKNINLGIPSEYAEKVLLLEKKVYPRYKLKKAFDRSGREWIDGDITGIYFKPRLKVGKVVRICITFKFFNMNNVRWIDGINGRSCKTVSSEYFKDLDTFNVKGASFPVPKNAERYLRERYGNLNDVIKKWDTNADDRTIIPSDLRKLLKRKTRNVNKEKPKNKILLTGANIKRAKKIIDDVAQILNKHGIPWWLDCGTLLGIIRDKELLPWDCDIDLCISGEDIDKLLLIQKEFYPKYRVKIHNDSSGRLPRKYRVAKLQPFFNLTTLLLFFKKLKLDIFISYPKGDGYFYWIDCFTLKRAPADFFSSLKKISWKNGEYFIPNNVEDYLTCRYGNWKKPVKKYDSSMDDRSIYEE